MLWRAQADAATELREETAEPILVLSGDEAARVRKLPDEAPPRRQKRAPWAWARNGA